LNAIPELENLRDPRGSRMMPTLQIYSASYDLDLLTQKCDSRRPWMTCDSLHPNRSVLWFTKYRVHKFCDKRTDERTDNVRT